MVGVATGGTLAEVEGSMTGGMPVHDTDIAKNSACQQDDITYDLAVCTCYMFLCVGVLMTLVCTALLTLMMALSKQANEQASFIML